MTDREKFAAEYIWIDGKSQLRSKTRILAHSVTLDEETDAPGREKLISKIIPDWTFDGSSTDQATTQNSEVLLKPRDIFRDPFRADGDVLILCDTYIQLTLNSGESKEVKSTPAKGNHRFAATQIFERNPEAKAWFGLEQEYFIMVPDGTFNPTLPLGFSHSKERPGLLRPEQGNHYCGVGAHHVFGRNLAEKHYEHCRYAGVKIAGFNAEVAPGQWEFQIGICEGIQAADHVMVARYILQRIAETHGLVISFAPKPVPHPFNGSGMHTNFSTKSMRETKGYDKILEGIEKLKAKHQEHLEIYGTNTDRLSGECETSEKDKFSWGVGNRQSSVRIPMETFSQQCGYFEDRRPASDADPYQVTAKIFETVVL